MSFAFLHPEFFGWMVPPVGVLFYFWMTQEPLSAGQFSPAALQRLRAEANTLGLRERNALFLAAALLLVAAMAQPVLIEKDGPQNRPAVILAIEGGTPGKGEGEFEANKNIAVAALKGFEAVSLIAYDTQASRIAPLSSQKAILVSLTSDLRRESFTTASDRTAMLGALAASGELSAVDGVVIVAQSAPPGTIGGYPRPVEAVASLGDIAAASEKIGRWSTAHRLRPHVPLFYYPLALATVLIWIALSSMSRRQAVQVASLLAVAVWGGTEPAQAGMLDFRLLDQARSAYEAGQYAKSAALYARYQQTHDLPQVRYNRATALLKGGDASEALYWFSKVHSTDPVLMERARINAEIARQTVLAPSDTAKTATPALRPPATVPQERASTERTKPAGGTRRFAFP